MSEGLKLEGQESDLPSGWKRVAIGDVCSFGGGKTPRKSDTEYWGGEIPWASPKDFNSISLSDTEDHLSEKGVQDNSINLYEEGDIAMVVRSGVLRHTLPIARLETQMAVNQDVKVLQPDTTKITSEYLLSILTYEANRIRASCAKTGTTVESIETRFLNAYKIPLPPLAEQRRIADILSTVDEQIQQTDEMIRGLGELKSGLLQDAFQSNFGKYSEIKSTPMGRFPERWPVRRIADVSTVVDGSTFPSDHQGKSKGELPFIKVSDTNDYHKYVTGAKNWIDRELLSEINVNVQRPGTVILPKRGAAILTNKRRILSQESIIDNNQIGVYPTEIDGSYLYHYLCTVDMERFVQTGAVKSINKSTVTGLKIPVPPEEEQERIGEILDTVDSNQAKERETKFKLKQVKRGLMQDLLTGNVRVDPDKALLS